MNRSRAARSVIGALVGAGALAPAVVGQPAFNSPIADEIFYHFMPISWRDSNNDANRFGDFGGMTASLDYLQGLGVTAVWMNPIFPSAAYHGYQHGPADQVDADFGTQQQFLDFVAAARARGIKVYLDFVAYGISHNSVYYQGAFGNPGNQYDSWLAFTNGGNTQYLGSVYNSWNGASVGFIHWDMRTAAVRNLVTTWGRKWLDPNGDGVADDGIAGYRFDHCWVQYGSGPDGWGYNLDDFWTPFFASLKQLKPDVFNFGEQADWGTRGTEFLPVFDGMFTIPFQFAARSSLQSGNAASMAGEMSGLSAAASGLGAGTFLGVIGTHDVDRLASVIGADSAGTIGKAKAAAAVLMLQPFAPVIYYGDELAMKGVKGNFGSDANDIPLREPFKWNAVAGAPMSNYWALNAQAFNNRFSQNNDGRSVQEQAGVPGSVLETYRTLISLRKAQPALRRGGYAGIPSASPGVWAFLRRHEPQGGSVQSLVALVNLTGSAANTSINVGAFTRPPGGAPVTDVQSGQALAAITSGNAAAYPVSIPAYGYRVLSADLAPPPPPVNLVDGLNIPATLSGAQLDVVQTAPTNLGNNTAELDRLMVRADAEGLMIGLTGNLGSQAANLAILIDATPDGTVSLYTADQSPPPQGLAELSFTLFDVGFAPETMFFGNVVGTTMYLDQLELQPSASLKTYRGSVAVNSGSGLLSGGTNPGGIQVALNNTNTSGVTGSSASGAALATSGLEMFIPYAELGLPTPACRMVRVAAFLSRADGSISSQHLPGVGTAATDIGFAPDFFAIPGTQFGVAVIAPACSPGCAADFNFSGVADTADLTAMLQRFGQSQVPGSVYDINQDGSVNTADLTLLLARFGQKCP